MYRVCAHYCWTTISVDEFETEQEAENCAKNPVVLFYKDEIENGEEDEVIYPNEMWVEEALPFDDPPTKTELKFTDEELEYLPF